jgi:hypothetical protein
MKAVIAKYASASASASASACVPCAQVREPKMCGNRMTALTTRIALIIERGGQPVVSRPDVSEG